jgi:hypothetical protein
LDFFSYFIEFFVINVDVTSIHLLLFGKLVKRKSEVLFFFASLVFVTDVLALLSYELLSRPCDVQLLLVAHDVGLK